MSKMTDLFDKWLEKENRTEIDNNNKNNISDEILFEIDETVGIITVKDANEINISGYKNFYNQVKAERLKEEIDKKFLIELHGRQKIDWKKARENKTYQEEYSFKY